MTLKIPGYLFGIRLALVKMIAKARKSMIVLLIECLNGSIRFNECGLGVVRIFSFLSYDELHTFGLLMGRSVRSVSR